ncbi:MAG: hypothetical protein GX591_03660 [Planctomycetes bacterium]|nr:hypothetical protein [Planctomycetota bacterium]
MHNHFIQTAVDMGLPAAAAMIGALLASLWHLERMRRGHRDDPFVANLAVCLQACLIGYILTGMFVSIGTIELPYIALAVEPTVRHRRRARALLQSVRPVPA